MCFFFNLLIRSSVRKVSCDWATLTPPQLSLLQRSVKWWSWIYVSLVLEAGSRARFREVFKHFLTSLHHEIQSLRGLRVAEVDSCCSWADTLVTGQTAGSLKHFNPQKTLHQKWKKGVWASFCPSDKYTTLVFEYMILLNMSLVQQQRRKKEDKVKTRGF